jgi:bifunctional polynucleotide phosphatase/kinase
MEVSYYVGDAAGRPGDHSDSDRKWALNVGLPFFTPEVLSFFHTFQLRLHSIISQEHFLKSNPIAFKLSGFNASLFPDDC